MSHRRHSWLLDILLLTWVAWLTNTAASSPTSQYIDVVTGITFYALESPTGYLFGMMMPQHPTTDFIAQIVTPLADGAGWGGVSFGSSMVGPLLLVTWADGNKVMTAARIATGHTTTDVTPYTSNPITISPIPQGTFVNSTHVSSTFLCTGCINSDSFDPAWAADTADRVVFLGYAFSQTAVDSPSDIDTALSDHTGRSAGYSSFRVVLSEAKSDDYEKYAAMARGGEEGGELGEPDASSTAGGDGGPTSTAAESGTSTGAPAATATTGNGCYESECEMPSGSDYSHRELSRSEFYALLLVGAVYLGQALMG